MTGIDVIVTEQEYQAKRKLVTDLSTDAVLKFSQNQPLSESDVMNLRKAEGPAASLVQYDPTRIWPYFMHGEILRGLGKPEKALDVFKEALSVATLEQDTFAQTIRAQMHNEMGQIYYQSHDYAEATESYMKAISIGPRDPWFRTNCAKALLAENRVTEAKLMLQTALEIDPNFEQAKELLSLITGEIADGS